MLLVVPGLVQAMPQPVLAAVIIAASISLFDVAELRRLFRVRKTEFALAVACGLGVAFIGVLQGIVVAVALSAIYIFKRAWAPYSAVLGKSPGVPGYHDIRRYPDADQVPGLLIVRWSAPLFFANANQFRDRIRDLVKTLDPPPTWVLVAAEPITDIDTTAGCDARRPRPRAERERDPPRVRRAPVGASATRSCGTGCSRPSTRGTSTAR